MALANVAVLIAQWKYKVLIVDWDLEAPGLEYFFKDYLDLETVTQQTGIVDLLDGVSNKESENLPDWRDSLINIGLPDIEGTLHLLTAGKRDSMYFNKLRHLNVDTMYAEQNGGHFVESLRNEWKQTYDFVLIDSRTGITDIGGICTVQLPDMLVLLFMATEQSLNGVIDVAKKATRARQKLPVERLGLISLPIPGKFDSQEEFKVSQEWLDRLALALSELFIDWLPTSVKIRTMLEMTKVPYIPYFSFGEKLPVLEQGTIDPAGLGYAYETLAALIANNLESVELLQGDRGGYIRLASKRRSKSKTKIFISYHHKDEEWKDHLLTHLRVLQKRGIIDLWDDHRIRPGHNWYVAIKKALDSASVALLLVSADFLASEFLLNEEIPNLLSQRKNEGLHVIPVIVRPCVWREVEWLARMQVLPKDGGFLSNGDKNQIDSALAEIATEVAKAVSGQEDSERHGDEVIELSNDTQSIGG